MLGGRVLFVTSSYPRWPDDASGAFVHRLAVDLTRCGWSVRVLAPHAPGLERVSNLDGVQVRRFRYVLPERLEVLAYGGGMLSNLRARPWTAATVPLFLAAERRAAARELDWADIVHAHWIVPQGLALVRLRRPLLLAVLGSDINRVGGRAATWLKRRALLDADVVTAISGATADAVRRVAEVEPVVVPLGIDPDPPMHDPVAPEVRHVLGSGPIAVAVARLVPDKGIDVLLRAAAAVPGLGVLVVGDGPQRAALEAMAGALGVPSLFVGAVPPDVVPSYLAAADIVVSPSYSEGLGLVAIEGMAVGRPVVATTVGGQVESVVDGATGFLVAPGDVEAMSAALRRLAGDPELRSTFGHEGRRRAVARYSRASVAAKHVELYQHLLATSQRHGLTR